MTAPRKPRSKPSLLAASLTLAMLAGCGGKTAEVDTAETIRTEPAAKPAPAPAPESTPTPSAEPTKEAPKG